MAENLQVRFWMDAYENPIKTREAGRKVYDTVPWCEIRVPGEVDTVIGPVAKMHPDPRNRFPMAWAQFQKDNTTEGLVGTPLKMVPWLERGDVETLLYSGVKTLEQLAGLSDGTLSNISGALGLRTKARDFIKAAQDAAPMEHLSEELAKRDLEIDGLKAQIAEILKAKATRGEEMPPEVKVRKKPGPKPKIKPIETQDQEH